MQKKDKHKQYKESLQDALDQLHDGLITKAEYEVLIESAARILKKRCDTENNK